jgi:hypothetical protein
MADLSQIPTDQLLQMLSDHSAPTVNQSGAVQPNGVSEQGNSSYFPTNTAVHASTTNPSFAADLAHQIPLMDKLAAATGATLQPLGMNGGPIVNSPSWGERYQKTLQNIRNNVQGYEASNPNAAYAAKAAGVVGPMLMGAGEASPLINALRGSAIGGAYGFSGTSDTSLPEDLSATAQGAGLGLATAGAGHGIGSLAGGVTGRVADAFTGIPQPKPQSLAAAMLMKSMERQGVTPNDLISQLSNSSKPITAMDIGGENSPLQRLGRTMVTLPGQQSQEITDFLNARQEGQRGRVLGNISTIAPNTDTYGTAANLRNERSVNSDSLYKKAFANPGVGPPDYEAARSDLINATAQKAGIVRQMNAIEQNSPGALAARGAAGADIRDQYMGLHQQLQDTEGARAAASGKFNTVQSAVAGNQALVDPRLAQFMSDPDIQAGMRHGLNIQRRLSLAKGEDFDPNAYAITHYDEGGNPVIGPVPTWQTLHAGREGLDSIIYSQEHPLTGVLPSFKDINSLKQLRAAYGTHLQSLNPDLKAADAAWSTPSQNLDAMALGQKFMRADPEQIAMARANLNPAADLHYQSGAGRQMSEVANDTKDNRNIPMRLTGDQTARDQLVSAFGHGPAQDFTNNMNLENQMAQTRQFMGGPNTANKAADIADAAHTGWLAPTLKSAGAGAMGGYAGGGLHGALIGGLSAGAFPIVKRIGSAAVENLFNNEPRNIELVRALTATGPRGATDLASLLAPAQQRAATIAKGRSIGSITGRAIGAGLIPALMSPTANAGP